MTADTGDHDNLADNCETVTVRVNLLNDGNIGYSIITDPAVSEDPGYNGRFGSYVSAINLDDETLAKARDVASSRNTTLDEMVQEFVRSVAQQTNSDRERAAEAHSIDECDDMLTLRGLAIIHDRNR